MAKDMAEDVDGEDGEPDPKKRRRAAGKPPAEPKQRAGPRAKAKAKADPTPPEPEHIKVAKDAIKTADKEVKAAKGLFEKLIGHSKTETIAKSLDGTTKDVQTAMGTLQEAIAAEDNEDEIKVLTQTLIDLLKQGAFADDMTMAKSVARTIKK